MPSGDTLRMNKLTTALILSGLLGLYFVVQATPPNASAPAESATVSTTTLGTLAARNVALAQQVQNLEANVTQLENGTAAPTSTTQAPSPSTIVAPSIAPSRGFDDGGYDD